MILAGDIGGTKTALGLYDKASGPVNPLAQEVFPSREYGSLEELTAVFIEKERLDHIETACFAVAGPILSGAAALVNLEWTINSASLARALGVKEVRLINDVEAVACSVPILGKDDLHTLNPGRPVTKGTMAVIAVGTGLGEAFLTWDGTTYVSHPTEGGHADFGPADEQQMGLLDFVGNKRGHVSWEVVCSGIGIPNIYDYLQSTGKYGDTGISGKGSTAGTDRTPSIIGAALKEESPDPLCADTLGMFTSILGAESGNLALKTMATGGVYVGGGIPPRIVKLLEAGSFLKAFKDKGRLTPMMTEIPVHVILNPRAALMGAASEAFRMVQT